MRPNRAAATPIGQQNQPGHLKLSVLDGKTGKYTDFDFTKIKPDFLDAQGVTLCGHVRRARRAAAAARARPPRYDQQYYKQAGKRTLTLRTFFKIVLGSGWGVKKTFFSTVRLGVPVPRAAVGSADFKK